MEICQKNLTPHPHWLFNFQDYSKSLEPTRIHRLSLPLTCDSFHSSHGRTVSDIHGDFRRKLQIFPTPVCLTPSPREFPRNSVMEIRQKNLTLMSRLSRLLEVIGTDTDRSATSDLWSIVAMGLYISYRFRDKRRFSSKLQIFPTPVCLTPSLREFPWKSVTAVALKETRVNGSCGNSSLVRRVICPTRIGVGLWLGLGLASNFGICTTTFRTNDPSDKWPATGSCHTRRETSLTKCAFV